MIKNHRWCVLKLSNWHFPQHSPRFPMQLTPTWRNFHFTLHRNRSTAEAVPDKIFDSRTKSLHASLKSWGDFQTARCTFHQPPAHLVTKAPFVTQKIKSLRLKASIAFVHALPDARWYTRLSAMRNSSRRWLCRCIFVALCTFYLLRNVTAYFTHTRLPLLPPEIYPCKTVTVWESMEWGMDAPRLFNAM
jgi:hypothetical protein